MTDAEAKALYAKLVLAFPAARREEGTEKVYVEALVPWTNSDRGLMAVTDVIHAHRDARTLPTIAVLNDAYSDLRDKFQVPVPQLEEPELTEKEREENVRRIEELMRDVFGAVK